MTPREEATLTRSDGTAGSSGSLSLHAQRRAALRGDASRVASAALCQACDLLRRRGKGAAHGVHSSTPGIREIVLQVLNKFIYVTANAGLWLKKAVILF